MTAPELHADDLLEREVRGSLTSDERARLEEHLADCPHCSEYLAQIQATVAAAGHVETDDLAPEALDELVSLYRQWRTG